MERRLVFDEIQASPQPAMATTIAVKKLEEFIIDLAEEECDGEEAPVKMGMVGMRTKYV